MAVWSTVGTGAGASYMGRGAYNNKLSQKEQNEVTWDGVSG